MELEQYINSYDENYYDYLLFNEDTTKIIMYEKIKLFPINRLRILIENKKIEPLFKLFTNKKTLKSLTFDDCLKWLHIYNDVHIYVNNILLIFQHILTKDMYIILLLKNLITIRNIIYIYNQSDIVNLFTINDYKNFLNNGSICDYIPNKYINNIEIEYYYNAINKNHINILFLDCQILEKIPKYIYINVLSKFGNIKIPNICKNIYDETHIIYKIPEKIYRKIKIKDYNLILSKIKDIYHAKILFNKIIYYMDINKIDLAYYINWLNNEYVSIFEFLNIINSADNIYITEENKKELQKYLINIFINLSYKYEHDYETFYKNELINLIKHKNNNNIINSIINELIIREIITFNSLTYDEKLLFDLDEYKSLINDGLLNNNYINFSDIPNQIIDRFTIDDYKNWIINKKFVLEKLPIYILKQLGYNIYIN